MAVNDQLSTRAPADELLERLEEPTVVAALNTLLDHADLLAILVVALEGLFTRGDVIANSLASAFGELKGASEEGGALAGVTALAGPLMAATPLLTTVLADASKPATIKVVGQLTAALAEAGESTSTRAPSTGVFALLRTLKDPDVARGLDFFTQVAKAFGKQRAS